MRYAMTEPKHTPGPWEIREVDGLFAIAHSGGWILESDDEQQDRADAKLIAAAPDLLEALRELHDFSMTMSNRTYRERSEAAFKNAAALLNRLGG